MRSHLKTAAMRIIMAAAAFCCLASAKGQDLAQEDISFEGLENLAFEKPVWTNGGIGQGHPELLTDGNTASDPYLGGPTRVGINFEDVVLINGVHIWHFWLTNPVYQGNIIALSETLGFEEIADADKDRLDEIAGIETVFNTDKGDEPYPETEAGKKIVFEPIEAQYLHAWLAGNNVNGWSHWVEIQAFFNPALLSVDPEGKAAAVWGDLKAR